MATWSLFCIGIPETDVTVAAKLCSAAVGPLQAPGPDGQSQRGKGHLPTTVLVPTPAARAALASELSFWVLHTQEKTQPRNFPGRWEVMEPPSLEVFPRGCGAEGQGLAPGSSEAESGWTES